MKVKCVYTCVYMCTCVSISEHRLTDHTLTGTKLVQDLVLVTTALAGVVGEVLNTVHDGADISSEVKEV